MKINGKTKTYGLIGNPVEHTLSPVIHNVIADRLSKNLVYVPFLVEHGSLMDAIKGAKALQLRGLNVTVPYKSEVMECIEEIDEMAVDIGAVNTLVSTKNGYKGFNTDMSGLARAMQSEDITITDEHVLILGAGGAARSVALLCASLDAKEIMILNRTFEKAKEVAEEVNTVMRRKGKREMVVAMDLTAFSEIPSHKYLAIQSTSVGLYPNIDDVVIEEDAFYQKIHTGVDLIYRPAKTKFMKLVEKHGGKTMNGLKMLLYQGVIAFELWEQVTVSEELGNEVYEIMKKELEIHE